MSYALEWDWNTASATENQINAADMKEEFKTVACFNDIISAEITAGMLRENGIPAQAFGAVSAYPSINDNINGIEVKVNAEDYEAAMKLLSEDLSEEEA